jgi:uncharacterized protein YhaN
MLVAAGERYRDACHLRVTLDACENAEARASQDEQQRGSAAQLVIAAARACALPAQTAQEAVEGVAEWLRERRTRLVTHDERAKLRALLGDGSLADLTQAADHARKKAAELAAAVDQDFLASVNEATARERLPKLRQNASVAQTQAANAAGELQQMAKSIGSVAEAEEEREAAKAELERVRELKQILELTRGFLQDARDTVHREIVPVLNQTVRNWLPLVTGGRYTDVTVDATSLSVRVCGPTRQWRYADQLSHGTAEQIYLLLRVALAEHLTRGRETCPLLLDDVTVHTDAARTRDLLNLLLRLSAERQIVVFTQEEQVAAWAREHLTGPRHAIVPLSPVAVG